MMKIEIEKEDITFTVETGVQVKITLNELHEFRSAVDMIDELSVIATFESMEMTLK